MAVDELADLLTRWRAADGMLRKGRVLSEGFRLVTALEPDERRELARSLAGMGAPHLAERLERSTEGAMGADQLWEVTDALLSLDDAQLDHLAASLRDPEARERLAMQAATGAVGAWSQGSADGGRDDPPFAARDHMAQDLGEQSLTELTVGSPDIVEVDVHEVELATSPGAVHAGAPERGDAIVVPEPERPAIPVVSDVPGSSTAELPTDGSTGSEDPEEHRPAADPDGHEGRHQTPPGAPGVRIVDDVLAADTATARLGALRTARIHDLDPDGALEVLDAFPDGWQRRRAAERLIDAAVLPVDDVAGLLGRFARPTDGVFVAGALVASGSVPAERFQGVLPAHAVRRLVDRSRR